MTSMLRNKAEVPKLATEFHRLESPCYYDNALGYNTLFPFTYSNGVLDVEYIDDFEADMVTSTGVSPSTDPDVSVRLTGSIGLVTSIGPKLEAYIRAWRTGIDSGTPVRVYVNGVVQKVQMTRDQYVGDGSWEESTEPPRSENYIIGSTSNSYRSTWVFKKPFTFTVVEGGVTKYITFATRFDED